MRKRTIHILVLAGILSASVFMDGCGKSTAETREAQTEKETVQETTGMVKETETETERALEETGDESKAEENAFPPDFLPVWIYTDSLEEYPVETGGVTQYLIQSEVPQFGLWEIDTEHEGLRKALESCSRNLKEEQQSFWTGNLDYAKTSYEEGNTLFAVSDYHVFLQLGRTDETVFSFFTSESTMLGGSSSEHNYIGYNYETVDGRQLSLKDVTADFDGLYSYVCQELDKDEEQKEYYEENYRQSVKEILQEENSDYNNFTWYFTNKGLTIVFEPYALSSYASVYAQAEIPYGTGLIRQEYEKRGNAWVQRVEEYEDVYADLNGDGKDEHFRYGGDRGQQFTDGKLEITCNDSTLSTESLQNPDASAGISTCGYLLHTKAGKTFFYVETRFSEDDYVAMSIYDLSTGKPVFVDALPDAVLPAIITIPEAFLLDSRVDILGTYYAYKLYHAGEKGLPESSDPEYRLDYETTLTSARELEVTMLDETGNPGEKETLPAGTVFTVLGTDGETYVRMGLEGGRSCRIEVQGTEDGWRTINGVDERDCFEYVPYAA